MTQSPQCRIPCRRSAASSAQTSRTLHRASRTPGLFFWKQLLWTTLGALSVLSDDSAVANRMTPRQWNARRLQTPQEQRSLLILRILDAPEDPILSTEQHTKLQSVLFNGEVNENGALPSVQEQMLLCSADRVRLLPLDVPNQDDNVVDVLVDQNLLNPSDYNEWVEVAAAIAMEGPLSSFSTGSFSSATAQIREVADHVLVLLPESFPSADTEFIATAEILNRLSIYSVPWATSLSAYMHELAHNLGLRHSGDDRTLLNVGVEYGDTSGYMGQSVISPWTPRKCYNAAQHWQLGWYDATNAQGESLRLSVVDASLPLQGSVAAFVDHEKLQNEKMVVLVQVESDIYLQFNRAKSYNSGTEFLFADKVVIVRDDGIDGTRLLATLAVDEHYTTPNGRTISVCQLVITDETLDGIDYAVLGIQEGSAVGCEGPSFMGDSAPLPLTISPTNSPTLAPIENAPTMETSVITTESPTSATEPTVSPVQAPLTPVAVSVGTDNPNVFSSSYPPSASPSARTNMRGSLSPIADAPDTESTDMQSSNGPAPSLIVLYCMTGLLVVAVVLLSMMLVVRRKRCSAENTRDSRCGESRSSARQSMSREIPLRRQSEADVHSGSKDAVTGATTTSSQNKRPKVIAPTMHNDESDSDVEDSLSVVLEQEIWKERVNEILQTCWLTKADDGSTHMVPRR